MSGIQLFMTQEGNFKEVGERFFNNIQSYIKKSFSDFFLSISMISVDISKTVKVILFVAKKYSHNRTCDD